MTDNRIYEQMAEHTLTHGGGTFARDAYRTVTLPNRYTVALGEPWTRVLTPGVTLFSGAERDLVVWEIADALRELANITKPWQTLSPFDPNPKALGTWIDAGTVYVDIVESLVHRGYALRTARERGQAAIFDQWTWKSVDVPTDD